MTTLRETITARVVVVLTGATDAGSNVFRSREAAISRQLTPAIVVMPLEESVRRLGQFTDVHELSLGIDIFTRGDPWDQLADTCAEVAHQAIYGDSVIRSLSANVHRASTDYESQEADRTAGVLSCIYTITYLTKAADTAQNP